MRCKFVVKVLINQSTTLYRFRLGVKVSHQNDSLKFVLWNKESTLNQIVTDIKNQLIQEVWICQKWVSLPNITTVIYILNSSLYAYLKYVHVGWQIWSNVIFWGNWQSVVRTIEKVLVANDWCYEGCPKCNRKCEEKLSPFICPGCQEENSSTVLR